MKQNNLPSSPTCRILAIDDESEVRNAYLHALTSDQTELENNIQNVFNDPAEQNPTDSVEGFDLTLAEQGLEAVALSKQALAEGAPFTVAFIDMRMPPGMDGLETAQELRKLDERIYIVFVTAYSDRSARELDQVMEHEILLLRKPFVNEEIYQLARSLSRSWQKDRKLEQALEAAEQANRAKDQFMAAVSHELRTPLSGLLGYGELLEKSQLNQDQQQLLAQMTHAGKGLLYRINDVLDATKLQSGRLDLHPAPFKLSQLVDELQELFLPQLQKNGLKLSIRCKLTTPDSRIGDRDRLLQILSNLLSNAIKFTPQGEINITLQEPEKERLSITIDDSGIGMSDEVLESAFHPFQQGDSRLSRSYSGIGMGLHISLQLAEMMGGTLTAESHEGKGSRFILTLPLPTESYRAPDNADVADTVAEQFSGDLLLVEDTPEMQMLIERMLTAYGLSVTVAENGHDGVEKALAIQYDLILMDLQMPVMGGIEATELLRQIGYTAPIIALTANITDSHREAFNEAGGDHFLTKPIEESHLKACLQKYLPSSEEGIDKKQIPLIDDELMALFLERITSLHQELKVAFQDKAWNTVQTIAHTIKGSGTTFGYPALTAISMEICDTILQQQLEPLEQLVPQLLAELESAIE